MKTTRHKCDICQREYEFEHGGDKGYSTDNICGPFCDGLRRGKKEVDTLRARLSEAERREKVLKEFAKSIVEHRGPCLREVFPTKAPRAGGGGHEYESPCDCLVCQARAALNQSEVPQ